MFREMRRKNQSLNEDDCVRILENTSSGVLAVLGDKNYPYTVPLNFAYKDNKIYFHCATNGHKLDSIRKNNKVSFCVVDKEEVIPDKFTTDYKSVIIFGKARIIEDNGEKAKTILYLCEKYSPDQKDSWQKTITNSINRFSIVEIDIEHISGKQSK